MQYILKDSYPISVLRLISWLTYMITWSELTNQEMRVCQFDTPETLLTLMKRTGLSKNFNCLLKLYDLPINFGSLPSVSLSENPSIQFFISSMNMWKCDKFKLMASNILKVVLCLLSPVLSFFFLIYPCCMILSCSYRHRAVQWCKRY